MVKKLQIAFSKPRSKLAIFSYLIRWADQAPFSHALLRWRAESLDRELVYQASHGMVHFMSGARFDEDAEIMAAYELELSDEEFNRIVQKCVDLAGVKYGLFQLWGMGLERLTGIKNPFRDGDHSFVCSELVGEILKLREGSLIDVDLELAGPKLLEACVARLPDVKKLK